MGTEIAFTRDFQVIPFVKVLVENAEQVVADDTKCNVFAWLTMQADVKVNVTAVCSFPSLCHVLA